MPLSKQIWIPLVAACGLGALGAYAYYANRSASGPQSVSPGAAIKSGGAPGVAPAVLIEATQVRTATVQEDATALGSLRSNESVLLRPESSGRISQLNFTEGARVNKGALLVALDSAVTAAELAQAKANLTLAESNYKRNEDLLQKQFVSAKARDETAAQLEAAKASVALSAARLAKMQIVAPFSGTIGIRQVSVGDYVKEGQDLVTLEDTSSLKVDFRLPENLAGRVSIGQGVELKTDAFKGEIFQAKVAAIDPLVDQAGRAVVLRAKLDNTGGKLRPGMYASVRLILDERANAMVVPEDALMPAGTDQFVFKVVDAKVVDGKLTEGKVQRVKIVTGQRRDARVEVLQGLQPGDWVVTAGHLKLRPDAAVRVGVPPKGNDAPAKGIGATKGGDLEKGSQSGSPAGKPAGGKT